MAVFLKPLPALIIRYYNFLPLFLLNDLSLGFLSTQRHTASSVSFPLRLQLPSFCFDLWLEQRPRCGISFLLPEVMHINQPHRCQTTSNQEHTKAQQEVIIGSVRVALRTQTSHFTSLPGSPDGLGFSSARRSPYSRGVTLSNAAGKKK